MDKTSKTFYFIINSEVQIVALVLGQADLLRRAMTAVIPEQPTALLVRNKGFIHGIMVPRLFATGMNKRVGLVTLPAGNAVARTCQANLCVVDIGKTDIKQQIPVTFAHDLPSSYFETLPGIAFIREKNGIIGMFCPLLPIRTRGVAHSIWFVLFAARIPHLIQTGLLIPEHMGAHQRHAFPWRFRPQDRSRTCALPVHTVFADRVSDTGTARRATSLPGIPHMIGSTLLHDARAIDVIFPTTERIGAKHDYRLTPMYSVRAFDQCHALLRSPGKPHPIHIALFQERQVKTGSQ